MSDDQNKKSGIEKRVHPRVDFFSKVKVVVPDESTAIDVFAGNVSRGGMFLRSNRPLPRGRKVALEFEVKETPVQVDEGEVVWTKPFEPISIDGAPAGMGVEFKRMSPDSQDRIAAFIDEEIGKNPTTPPPAEASQPESSPPPAGPPKALASSSPDEAAPAPAARVVPPASPAPRAEPSRMKLAIGSPVDSPGPDEQGEPLMVSEPPPPKTRALLFGIFVLVVAAATFVTLYVLKPFGKTETDQSTTDAPLAEAPVGEDPSPPQPEPRTAPAREKAPARLAQPAPEPTPQASPPREPEPSKEPVAEQAPQDDGKLRVGEPAYRQASDGWRLVLKATRAVETKHFTLKQPPRLAVDFLKATYSGKERTLDAPPPFISKVRVGEQPDFTRYVVDFDGDRVPAHKVIQQPDGVTIVFAQ